MEPCRVCPTEVKPGVVSIESLRDGKTRRHQEDQKTKAKPWRRVTEVEPECRRTEAELVWVRTEEELERRRRLMEPKGWKDEA